MTRHRRRRHRRLIDPARSFTVAICIVAGLGGLLASPAGQPDDRPHDPSPSIVERPGGNEDRTSRSGDRTANPVGTDEPRGTPTSPAPSISTSPTPDVPASRTPDTRTSMEDEVVRLTNAERAKAGCEALRADERLRTAARGHSDDMAGRQYFSHTSPEGETPWDRAAEAGYPSPSAENIAHGYPDAESVVAAWMASEGHRANILSCASKAVGVGVTLSGAGAPYWTQMFGYD